MGRRRSQVSRLMGRRRSQVSREATAEQRGEKYWLTAVPGGIEMEVEGLIRTLTDEQRRQTRRVRKRWKQRSGRRNEKRSNVMESVGSP